MIRLLLFVHIVAAMVYFGLPMTFGRWFRGGLATGGRTTGAAVLLKVDMFARKHLNISGVLSLLTGLGLMTLGHRWQAQIWPYLAILLLFLSLANINLLLLPAVKKGREDLSKPDSGPFDATRLTRRISLFSALHHTVVTLIIALMVFQPF